MVNDIMRRTVESLKKNGFLAYFIDTAAVAKEKIMDMIPSQAVVGTGDSATLKQIGIFDAFAARSQHVINPFTRELTTNVARRLSMHMEQRRSLSTDVYLVGCNAVTLDGKLVNIDRVGNRLAGMIFGAPKVIVVVGQNKIVSGVEEALYRIKNVIAPAHASWKGRKTPCAITGKCNDCNSPDRICRITLIIEKKPQLTEMTVILVGEDLGLGWDPIWPRERIEAIRARYQECTWSFPTLQNKNS